MRPNNVKRVAGTTRFLVSYRDKKELETLMGLHGRALQWGVLTVREHWQALGVPGMFKCIREELEHRSRVEEEQAQTKQEPFVCKAALRAMRKLCNDAVAESPTNSRDNSDNEEFSEPEHTCTAKNTQNISTGKGDGKGVGKGHGRGRGRG